MQNAPTASDKEYVTIDGNKYYIKTIPALEAERMFFEVLPVLQSLDISKLPFSFLMELMPYCGIYNQMTNAEIDFNSPDLIGMYITKPAVLMELQARVLGKNFSFFFRRVVDKGYLRTLKRLSSKYGGSSYGYPNVSSWCATVISEHLATLHELKTIYSLEDLLKLYEIVEVNHVNKMLAMERHEQEMKAKAKGRF